MSDYIIMCTGNYDNKVYVPLTKAFLTLGLRVLGLSGGISLCCGRAREREGGREGRGEGRGGKERRNCQYSFLVQVVIFVKSCFI